MEKSYKEILKDITTVIFDVDGVFTDSSLYLFPGHPPVRKMNVKDGYALQLAIKKGYNIAIITGGNSEEVKVRFEGLGLKDIFLSSHDKIAVFEKYIAEKGITAEEVLYMGDDIPDLPVMKRVALPCCPNDADSSIREASKYVSPKKGGEGCVRDVLEQLMKLNGQWLSEGADKW